MIISIWLTQSSASAGPDLGIELKGGLDAATTTNESGVDLHDRYGLTGGLAGQLRWPLGEIYTFAAQLEVLYVPRGFEATSGGEDLGQNRHRYFDLVVAARPGARLGPAEFYLVLGGGVCLLTSADVEGPSGRKVDITDDLHRADVALIAGVGGALRLPHRRLGPFALRTVFVEARYNHGLLDTGVVNEGFKNRTSALMLGLSLSLSSGSPGASSSPAIRAEPTTSAVTDVE